MVVGCVELGTPIGGGPIHSSTRQPLPRHLGRLSFHPHPNFYNTPHPSTPVFEARKPSNSNANNLEFGIPNSVKASMTRSCSDANLKLC